LTSKGRYALDCAYIIRTTTTDDASVLAPHTLLILNRYLLADKILMVDTLIQMTRLTGEGTDASEALHNSLEALQKLSERRSVQKLMIRHEVSEIRAYGRKGDD
jgi:hypothetical protein